MLSMLLKFFGTIAVTLIIYSVQKYLSTRKVWQLGAVVPLFSIAVMIPLYGLPFPSEGMACRSTKRAVRTRHRTPYTVQAGNHLTVFFLRL